MTAKEDFFKRTVYRWSVSFDGEVVLLVKKGQLIDEGESIAKVSEKSEEKIDLVNVLGVKGEKAAAFLKKKLGEGVLRGEVLAQRKKIFGSRKVCSSISGEVASIDAGGLLTVCSFEEKEEHSDFAGRVVEAVGGKVVVEFPALSWKGDWGRGGRIVGVLRPVSTESLKEGLFELDGDFSDKILVVGGRASRAFWFKALALGVAGVIVDSVSQKFLTQEKKVLASLVVVGGQVGNEGAQKAFLKHKGKKVLVEGRKKELIIPLKDLR
jgi:hypothetical protein